MDDNSAQGNLHLIVLEISRLYYILFLLSIPERSILTPTKFLGKIRQCNGSMELIHCDFLFARAFPLWTSVRLIGAFTPRMNGMAVVIRDLWLWNLENLLYQGPVQYIAVNLIIVLSVIVRIWIPQNLNQHVQLIWDPPLLSRFRMSMNCDWPRWVSAIASTPQHSYIRSRPQARIEAPFFCLESDRSRCKLYHLLDRWVSSHALIDWSSPFS